MIGTRARARAAPPAGCRYPDPEVEPSPTAASISACRVADDDPDVADARRPASPPAVEENRLVGATGTSCFASGVGDRREPRARAARQDQAAQGRSPPHAGEHTQPAAKPRSASSTAPPGPKPRPSSSTSASRRFRRRRRPRRLERDGGPSPASRERRPLPRPLSRSRRRPRCPRPAVSCSPLWGVALGCGLDGRLRGACPDACVLTRRAASWVARARSARGCSRPAPARRRLGILAKRHAGVVDDAARVLVVHVRHGQHRGSVRQVGLAAPSSTSSLAFSLLFFAARARHGAQQVAGLCRAGSRGDANCTSREAFASRQVQATRCEERAGEAALAERERPDARTLCAVGRPGGSGLDQAHHSLDGVAVGMPRGEISQRCQAKCTVLALGGTGREERDARLLRDLRQRCGEPGEVRRRDAASGRLGPPLPARPRAACRLRPTSSRRRSPPCAGGRGRRRPGQTIDLAHDRPRRPPPALAPPRRARRHEGARTVDIGVEQAVQRHGAIGVRRRGIGEVDDDAGLLPYGAAASRARRAAGRRGGSPSARGACRSSRAARSSPRPAAAR